MHFARLSSLHQHLDIPISTLVSSACFSTKPRSLSSSVRLFQAILDSARLNHEALSPAAVLRHRPSPPPTRNKNFRALPPPETSNLLRPPSAHTHFCQLLSAAHRGNLGIMRLYLLPISTRRTLLYAQRLNVTTTESNSGYIDKATTVAAKKWAEWEKKESGWQRKVVDYGNHALRRIPFEEWGLKSVPPLSTRRKDDELRGKEKVQLVFPRAAIPLHKVESVIRTLANEREGLHKKRLIWCVVGMPLTIPVGILPV